MVYCTYKWNGYASKGNNPDMWGWVVGVGGGGWVAGESVPYDFSSSEKNKICNLERVYPMILVPLEK